MSDKMIENLEAKTGKSLKHWIAVVKKSGEEKHMANVKHLKTNHGLTHGYANLIVHLAKDSSSIDKPKGDLVSQQYSKGKEELKPIYDKLIQKILKFGSDVEIAPKKTYVSLRRKKQFALIQPSTKTRIDIGIKLKGKEPSQRLEKSGNFNSMVSHRIRISSLKDVNKEVIDWLKEAYMNAG